MTFDSSALAFQAHQSSWAPRTQLGVVYSHSRCGEHWTNGNLHSKAGWKVLHRMGYDAALLSSSFLTPQPKLLLLQLSAWEQQQEPLSKKVSSEQSTRRTVTLERVAAWKPHAAAERLSPCPQRFCQRCWLGSTVLASDAGISRRATTTYMYPADFTGVPTFQCHRVNMVKT